MDDRQGQDIIPGEETDDSQPSEDPDFDKVSTPAFQGKPARILSRSQGRGRTSYCIDPNGKKGLAPDLGQVVHLSECDAQDENQLWMFSGH